MIKYKYNIVLEETTISMMKIKHFKSIEASCFDECIKKCKEEFSCWEIIEVVRL